MTENEYNYSRYCKWKRIATISLTINGWFAGLYVGAFVIWLLTKR